MHTMNLFSQKRILFLVLAACSIYPIYKGINAWDRRNDGFAIEKIGSEYASDPKWNIAYTPQEIAKVNHLLDQPFSYLGRGFQCYAFISADGNYVLKFVRYQRLRPPEIFDWLPQIEWVKKMKQEKQELHDKRKNYIFTSFKLAYECVPHETALLYVHLNKTKGLHKRVCIRDRVGTTYEIPIDRYEFVLQQKAFLIKPTIEQLMREGKVDEAKKRIGQIFQLLTSCAKKGVLDTDGALIRKNNLGFLDDRAIYIDAGKLALKSKIKRKKVFVKDLKRLRPFEKWLEEHYPSLVPSFDRQKQLAIEEF